MRPRGRRRFHAQEHLVGGKRPQRYILCHERVETAEVVYADRLHDAFTAMTS